MPDETTPETPQEEAKPAAASTEAPASETPHAKAAEAPQAEAPEATTPEASAPAKKEETPAKKEESPKRGGDRNATDDIFAEIAGEAAEEKVKVHKAKGSKNVNRGLIHVLATFNNTLVSIADQNGNVIGWASAGKLGFKGSRKSTAYAAQEVSKDALRQAMSHGLKEAEVRVKGPGSGRESAVRAIQALGVDILSIRDVTPIPHNGCRPPKARRV